MDKKKKQELQYLEEARRASLIFPSGDATPQDPLDFLLPSARDGCIGVEVTELCRESERGEGARLGYVVPKAKQLYWKLPGAKPVSVSPALSAQASALGVDQLAASLAEFVYAHRDSNAGFDRNLPPGYCHIGVFPPVESEGDGQWRSFRAFDVVRASYEMLNSVIAKKNARVASYPDIASEVWLLIVNDQFLGPGEVHANKEDLKGWVFDFTFDKVLLFARNPGGSGEVIELRSGKEAQSQ